MDLRSQGPYWIVRDGGGPAYPPLQRDADCDACVVGSGIAGALAAYRLTRAGLRCMVIDRREIAHGSTAASTALLLYDLDTPLVELSERLGLAAAARCYALGVEAIDEIERLSIDLASCGGGACGYSRRESLWLASSDADVPLLERECRARRDMGLLVRLLTANEVSAAYPFDAPAAILSPIAAEVDGYRLSHALLADAAAGGAPVHTKTRATALRHDGHAWKVQTQAGPTITASRVVLATGYEASEHIAAPLGRLVSTYALVTTPIADFHAWQSRTLIWETAHPYLYLRTTDDGRAMIGGGDEPITDPDQRDALIPRKAAELMDRFRAMFPKIRCEAEHAWAGFFIETDDGLPWIGEVPTMPGVILALTYGANGTTFGAVAARIIEDLCLGRQNDDARLFALDRSGH